MLAAAIDAAAAPPDGGAISPQRLSGYVRRYEDGALSIERYRAGGFAAECAALFGRASAARAAALRRDRATARADSDDDGDEDDDLDGEASHVHAHTMRALLGEGADAENGSGEQAAAGSATQLFGVSTGLAFDRYMLSNSASSRHFAWVC